MRKLFLALLSFLLVATACERSDQLNVAGDNPPSGVQLSGDRFYGVKLPAEDASTRGVAQRHKLWYPGSTIKIVFLNGSEEYQQKVRTYAAEWLEYAGITFQYVTEGKADVRIGFDWNDDRYITWSYIGTDCKFERNQQEATMSFADWRRATEEEKKGDVLRAFGSMLGLELEHRHLSFDADWSDRIADYWEGDIMDIPWDELREYVFDPLQASEVIMTREYDENSIMIWPFSRRYAGNTQRDFNYELSELDKEFIGEVYPKEEEEDAIVIKTLPITEAAFYAGAEYRFDPADTIIVDWGDGSIESYYSKNDVLLGTGFQGTRHVYSGSPASYTIKIYHIDKILSLTIDDKYHVATESIDISKCQRLHMLRIENNLGLKNLDISQNNYLNQLYLTNTGISSLKFPKNSKLQHLDISQKSAITFDGLSELTDLHHVTFIGCNYESFKFPAYNALHFWIELHDMDHLTSVDVSDLPELVGLSVRGCKNLTMIDVTNNKRLDWIDVNNNSLTSLTGLSKESLRILSCENNLLTSLDISGCQSLTGIACSGNPFINDKTELVKLAQSLPMGSGNREKLTIGNETSKSWIEGICTAKYWTVE